MITAPTRDNKAATSTPVNIAVVHATQRARGVTIRTTPNRVKRMSGTVHIYLPCLPNLRSNQESRIVPWQTPPPLGDAFLIYILSTYRRGILKHRHWRSSDVRACKGTDSTEEPALTGYWWCPLACHLLPVPRPQAQTHLQYSIQP